MPTRTNAYYNNPTIGAAISNLASIFEPPQPQDVLAYAQAEKTRKEIGGIGSLYAAAERGDQGAIDLWGAATGTFNPTSGFGARDQASADRRYGVDVGASVDRRGQDIASGDRRYGVDVGAQTDRATALLGAQAGLAEAGMTPLNQGQVRPGLDPALAEHFDMPAIGAAQGAPKPPSLSEVEGLILGDAVAQGLVTPQTAADRFGSDISVETILGADGPQIVSRAQAIGQAPYINPGSVPAKQFKSYRTLDGSPGIAILDPFTGRANDQATGQPLPQGAVLGDVQDTSAGFTAPIETDIQKDGREAVSFLSTLDQLQGLVSSSPSSQGLVGALRGTAQNVIATGGELGNFLGGTTAEVAQAVQKGMIDQGLAQEMFDPSLPAIDMLSNVLAWKYAKSIGGDRVSNEQLRQAKIIVGSGQMFGNQQDTLARLGQLRGQFENQVRRDFNSYPPELQGQLAPFVIGTGAATPSAPADTAPPAEALQPGMIVDGHRFLGGDPTLSQSWAPVQ